MWNVLTTMRYVLTFLGLLLDVSLGLLDIDELKLLNYVIDLNGVPVVQGEEVLGSSLQLSTKLGQKYQCLLPDTSLALENEANANNVKLDPSKVDIGEMLKPLESEPCIIRTQSWWTYEFCYKRHISQYHLEEGKKVGLVMKLGYYGSDYDWLPHIEMDKDANELKSSQKLHRYHSQYYGNGSVCDLTGEPRKTEIQFRCEEGSIDYIFAVEEPRSCQYVVHIKTSRVCEHAFLKPLPVKTPHLITCQPVLLPEQYEKYQKYDKAQKDKEEKERQQWLKEQEEKIEMSDVDKAKKNKGVDIELEFINVNSKDESSKSAISYITNELKVTSDLENGEILNLGKNEQTKIGQDEGDRTANVHLVEDIDTEQSESAMNLDEGENFPPLEVEEILRLFSEFEIELDQISSLNDQLHSMLDKDDSDISIGVEAKKDTPGIESDVLDSIEQANQNPDTFHKPDPSLDDVGLNLIQNRVDNKDHSQEHKKGDDVGVEKPLDLMSSATSQQDKVIDEAAMIAVMKRLESTSNQVQDTKMKAKHQLALMLKLFSYRQKLAKLMEKARHGKHEDNKSTLGKLDAILKKVQDKMTHASLDTDESVDEDYETMDQVTKEDDKLDGKHKELEQNIMEELEKTGMDTGGKKIQVKIITTRLDDNNALRVLDEEESQSFRDMIVSLLSSSYAAEKEEKSHKEMENNYNTNWQSVLENFEDAEEDSVPSIEE